MSGAALHWNGGRKLESAMPVAWLLTVCAIIETATGIALIGFPNTVARLLLGANLAGAGLAVGRVAGFALLALGVICWVGRKSHGKDSAELGMFTYNSMTAIYLACLGVDGDFAGKLLWPAVAVHAALAVLRAQGWLLRQR
jgi:hypothetical protein